MENHNRRLGFERRCVKYTAHIPERRQNGGRRWNDKPGIATERRTDSGDAYVHVEKEVGLSQQETICGRRPD